MKRYTFYLLVTLLTFGIGFYFALDLFWTPNLQTSSSPQFLNNISKKTDFKSTFPKPFDPSQKQEEKPNKPFCYDKNFLPIWKVLLKDKDFQEWEPISEYSLDCKDMLEIKKIDLNQDGTVEILLRGNNFNLCSPVGNCAFWIFEKRSKNYRKILYSTDYIDVSKLGQQILKTKTNGYSDILLKGHLSASDTSYRFFTFDGRKYKISKDLVEACIVCVGENPKWEMMTAKKYWNSQH
ncbi:MAG: hypothetical protein AAB336_09635 [Acidobacteriota bacterium]